MSTEGSRVASAGSLGAASIASSGAGQRVSQELGQNPGPSAIKVDYFDPRQQTFQRWLQRLEGAFRVFKIREEAEKVAYLLHYLGVEAFGILCDRLDPEDPYTLSYGALLNRLKEFYAPEPLEIAEIFMFRKRLQQPEENAQEYMAALQKLSLHCKFGEYLKTELRNQFVFGLRNQRIQGRLLETAGLTMESALKTAGGMELAERGVQELKTHESAAVDFVGHGACTSKKTNSSEVKSKGKGVCKQKKKSESWNKSMKVKASARNSKFNNVVCYRCGRDHLAPHCTLPRHVKCNECGGMGHLQKVCKKKNQTKLLEEVSRVEELEHSRFRDQYTVSLYLENKRVTFEVDCGAAVTLVSKNWLRRMFPSLKLYKTDLKLRSYCKKNFAPLGFVKVRVHDMGGSCELNAYVVHYDRNPLLGREWINQLKILEKVKRSLEEIEEIRTLEVHHHGRLEQLFTKYSNIVSEDFALIKQMEAHLKLKENAKPVFLKSRTVPFKLKEKVEEEIENMVQAGILEKKESSKWATPIVPVLKKNGQIRICGDFSVTVNPLLIVDEHPLPTIDELFASMAGGKIFSKIDLKQAYLQLPLAESEREILTLNTHKGLYQCNRLMYGVAAAPAIWQRTIENILSGIPGVAVFLDDIRVSGKNLEEHMARLELVFKQLSKYNLRINKEKCEFLQDNITYCGYVIGKSGISKEKQKIEAVRKMPRPDNLTKLRAFIGLINYYGRFIKNLSDLLRPLNNLLKKNVPFRWSKACESAFKKAKIEFESNKILVPFDPKLPLVLATDASPYGVGAVLSHTYPDGSERIIQCASNSLTETQKKYAQIDKEAYAIVFGIKKFHQFLFGNHFTLITDHKPLAQIFKPQKGLPAYSAMRMQHYAVFLQAFNFNIKYRKSEDHGNADGFSRLPINETRTGEYDPIDVYQIDNLETLPVTAKEIIVEMRKDKELSKIIKALKQGKSLVPLGFQDNEFTIQNEILFRKDRVVIPKTLKERVLKELHEGHFGIVKMKNLSRSYCWWLGIDRDIEILVKNCKACNTFSNNPKIVIKHRWEPATEPFQRVHIDFAGPFMGCNFLVLVDAHTKWPEVHLMRNISTKSTVEKCREIFTTFGLPQTLVTDNGRTFISKEFQTFLRENGIFHKNTAPYNPATNGLAERFVQTLKQGLRKLNTIGQNVKLNVQKILFNYRLSPHQETGKSPAELMFGRKLNSRLNLLFPRIKENIENDEIKNMKITQFEVGESVAVREYLDKNIKWRFGKIIEKLGKLHYRIKLNDGKVWKRHVNQMRAVGSVLTEKTLTQMLDYGDPNMDVNVEPNICGDVHAQTSTDPERERLSDVSRQLAENAGARNTLLEEEQEGAPDRAIFPEAPIPVLSRERSTRLRKPPERFGEYLSF